MKVSFHSFFFLLKEVLVVSRLYLDEVMKRSLEGNSLWTEIGLQNMKGMI